MQYAVRLDSSISSAKRRNEIAAKVAPHLGIGVLTLERHLERPNKSILVRSNKRTAAEFIARWLRAYGVQVTVLENQTPTTIRITQNVNLTIPPKANGFMRVPLGRQPAPTLC